jgi:quercetin dioxygenase-like cupin family protein
MEGGVQVAALRPQLKGGNVMAMQPQGINRTDLQQHDLSLPGREVVQNRVDLSPEAPPVKHKHPGEEIIYVLEGSLEYQVEDHPPTTVNAGGVFFIPAETAHAVKNVGNDNAAELARYVVEKGKPLLEPAE